ncbi:hypothetical protein ACG2LH_18080 [Zhouia sp. PK063]|uniref:hypothetical protein n=1 Tax=Zhouia sp. PK063 TaxID=3373602 RepID=UPI0037A77D10
MEEKYYYLNSEPNVDGYHYVHAYECTEKPRVLFQVKLGFFSDAEALLEEAHHYFSKVKLCPKCCPKPITKTNHLNFALRDHYNTYEKP